MGSKRPCQRLRDGEVKNIREVGGGGREELKERTRKGKRKRGRGRRKRRIAGGEESGEGREIEPKRRGRKGKAEISSAHAPHLTADPSPFCPSSL